MRYVNQYWLSKINILKLFIVPFPYWVELSHDAQITPQGVVLSNVLSAKIKIGIPR